MALPAKCRVCGHEFQDTLLFGGTGTGNTFVGCEVSCPKCGGTADVQSGTYDFVDSVITAFTAPGMTRQKVEAFGDLAKKAAQDGMSQEAAAQQADKIKPGLGDVLRAAHGRGITFDRVLAVVLAFLAFWSEFAPDAELQALLEESQRQTELSQKMLEELQRQNADGSIASPTIAKPQAAQGQTNAPKNRHERLKAKSLERRAAKVRSRSAPKGDGGARK